MQTQGARGPLTGERSKAAPCGKSFKYRWSGTLRETQRPSRVLCTFLDLKPGIRKKFDWGFTWSLVGLSFQGTVVRAVSCHFSYDSPGWVLQLSAFLGCDPRTRPQHRALACGKALLVAKGHMRYGLQAGMSLR